MPIRAKKIEMHANHFCRLLVFGASLLACRSHRSMRNVAVNEMTVMMDIVMKRGFNPKAPISDRKLYRRLAHGVSCHLPYIRPENDMKKDSRNFLASVHTDDSMMPPYSPIWKHCSYHSWARCLSSQQKGHNKEVHGMTYPTRRRPKRSGSARTITTWRPIDTKICYCLPPGCNRSRSFAWKENMEKFKRNYQRACVGESNSRIKSYKVLAIRSSPLWSMRPLGSFSDSMDGRKSSEAVSWDGRMTRRRSLDEVQKDKKDL